MIRRILDGPEHEAARTLVAALEEVCVHFLQSAAEFGLCNDAGSQKTDV